tara:strand:+ start:329 stop:631 length:303 start_codon:yes stop_codon:yes gene_type:complete
MVTEEDYLEALEVVTAYHKQLGRIIDYSKTVHIRTPIELWFSGLEVEVSARLRNALLNNYFQNENGKPFEFLEDINRRDFMKLKNTGEKTWKEFIKLNSK